MSSSNKVQIALVPTETGNRFVSSFTESLTSIPWGNLEEKLFLLFVLQQLIGLLQCQKPHHAQGCTFIQWHTPHTLWPEMETEESQEKGSINPVSQENKQGTERKPFPGNKYQYKSFWKIYLTLPSWLKLNFHFVLLDINLSHSGEWQTRQVAVDGAHFLWDAQR